MNHWHPCGEIGIWCTKRIRCLEISGLQQPSTPHKRNLMAIKKSRESNRRLSAVSGPHWQTTPNHCQNRSTRSMYIIVCVTGCAPSKQNICKNTSVIGRYRTYNLGGANPMRHMWLAQLHFIDDCLDIQTMPKQKCTKENTLIIASRNLFGCMHAEREFNGLPGPSLGPAAVVLQLWP